MMLKRILIVLLGLNFIMSSSAQTLLSLDDCRRLALEGNKSLAISRVQQEKALNEKKAASTNYLPKVSVAAGYMRTGRQVSLLSDDQRATLNNLGNSFATAITGSMPTFIQQITPILQKYPEFAGLLTAGQSQIPAVQQQLNALGGKVADAFTTDTRNMGGIALMLTQPLFMGGKIRAYDRITKSQVALADEKLRASEQEVLLEVEQAYWQVISLVNKRKLAESYLEMLQRLEKDISVMVKEGVATRSNELSVNVKVNEAEMMLTKADDGLTLSRMLLCQLCNLPLNMELSLADESLSDLKAQPTTSGADATVAMQHRPELAQLELAHRIYKEKVNIERAAYLPQVALIGGYGFMTPNLWNGFSNKLKGDWAVGITLKMPVWNWGEAKYKINAARADAMVQQLRLDDVKEKVTLQVNQSAFAVNEASKKLSMSLKNLEKAEENLRMSQIGFKEGVITTTDALAAHTAWMQAQSEKIDAQIDIRIADAMLRKACGTLN